MVGLALDRRRQRGGTGHDGDDSAASDILVPYKGPIAPPSAHRPLRLLPQEANASGKAVVYEGSAGWQQQQEHQVKGAKADDRRTRAFSPASPLGGGGIGESPRNHVVRVAGSSTSSSGGGFHRRRDGSGSSHTDSAGRASFSRTARELFPFISSPPPTVARLGTGGGGLHAVRSPPGLSAGSTPTTDSFASSTSDYEPAPRTSSASSAVVLGRQRSNSTSNLARPSHDLPWEPVPPLVRSRSAHKARVAPRKISEPFLIPGEPVEAEAFTPSRPVPSPSPEKLLRSPGTLPASRGIPPYLRAKPDAVASTLSAVPRPDKRAALPADVSNRGSGGGGGRRSTMYEASTFCDTVVFPQPKLKPFLISPPPTPRSSTTSSIAFGANIDREDPDLVALPHESDGSTRRLTFEDRVRREGETREFERAAWARAATKQAALTRSFDVKRNRRRSKSLTHLRSSAEGRFSFEPEGPNDRPINRGPDSPDMPSSFAFLRTSEARPRKASFDEPQTSAAAEPRSPLRSAMRLIRRSTSLGNLTEERTRAADPLPQLPHVRIVKSLHADHSRQQSTYAGRTPPAGLRLLPSDMAPSEGDSVDVDGPVIDISRSADDDFERAPWGSVRGSEDHQSESAEILAVRSSLDEVGIALSPVAATFDLTTTQAAMPVAAHDRYRHASSRSGSVSSIQAFHRRFPSTASSSSAAPRPASHEPHLRHAWQGHGAGQSLDSAAFLRNGQRAEADNDDDDALSSALRAGRRMSKAPSDRQRAPGEGARVDSVGNLPRASSTRAHYSTGAVTPEPIDNYTAIPVVRPLARSSSSSPRSGRGLQQAWAFPRQRDRHLSTESRATSVSSGVGRGSNDATPVPLFVYGDDYENLFYQPELASRETINASPARPVHISYASLGASSGDTVSSDGVHSEDDHESNATITRVSRHQVPALRSPDSVDRRDYFHLPHRRSLVPELGGSSPPRTTTAPATTSTLDSPDDAARSGVLRRFPRPPLPTEHAASYATTTDGRSVIYVDALSTPFDDHDDEAYEYDGRPGSAATTTGGGVDGSRGYDSQTQDSHYVTADDESQARFGNSEAGSPEIGFVY